MHGIIGLCQISRDSKMIVVSRLRQRNIIGSLARRRVSSSRFRGHSTIKRNVLQKIYHIVDDIVKLNDPFKFEKEIYIDRFLDENKQTYLEIRNKVNQIKEQQKHYEAGMESLKSFKYISLWRYIVAHSTYCRVLSRWPSLLIISDQLYNRMFPPHSGN